MYQELSQGSAFAYDEMAEYIVSNTAYIITGSHLQYLLRMLNSKTIEYAYRHFYATILGTNGLRWLAQHIQCLPVPLYNDALIQKKIIKAKNDSDIENLIFELFDFTYEEIDFIDNNT